MRIGISPGKALTARHFAPAERGRDVLTTAGDKIVHRGRIAVIPETQRTKNNDYLFLRILMGGSDEARLAGTER